MYRLNHLLLIFFVFIAVISACSLAESVEPTPTQEPTSTETPVPSATPTKTPTPTMTPSPTPTVTPTPLDPETILARNYPAVQERGLVEVEIVRFLIGEKDVILSGHTQLEGEKITPSRLDTPSFDGREVVGELVLRITNKQTERVASLFLADLIIGISGQQKRLEEFILDDAVFGDDINPFNPDILPETSVLIGFWFAFEDIDVSEITKVNIVLDSPYESRGNIYYPLGNDYFFSIDFTEPIFESVPEELQS